MKLVGLGTGEEKSIEVAMKSNRVYVEAEDWPGHWMPISESRLGEVKVMLIMPLNELDDLLAKIEPARDEISGGYY